MNVLIINKKDVTGGGAFIAGYRHFQALKHAHIDAHFLVLNKTSTETDIISIPTNFWSRLHAKLIQTLSKLCDKLYGKNNGGVFSVGKFGVSLSKHPLVQQADIIHIHWINQGLLSIKGLAELKKLGKPIFWTAHDMWSLTGGCHYSGSCIKFSSSCSYCPQVTFSGKNDISQRLFTQKQQLYKQFNLRIVACSNWMKSLAIQSPLLKDNHIPVNVIPNPIDITLFNPIEKELAKKDLGIDTQKKTILFVSVKVNDLRKGFSYFKRALSLLSAEQPELKGQLQILIMGTAEEKEFSDFPFPVSFLGHISNQKKLVTCYAAAEVLVVPSLEDNLPNTVMEAMACGTAVTAFHTGGIPDMIDHLENGYLAAFLSEKDLKKGVLHVLANSKTLGEKARLKVVNTFSYDKVASQFIDLYQEALSNR